MRIAASDYVQSRPRMTWDWLVLWSFFAAAAAASYSFEPTASPSSSVKLCAVVVCGLSNGYNGLRMCICQSNKRTEGQSSTWEQRADWNINNNNSDDDDDYFYEWEEEQQ